MSRQEDEMNEEQTEEQAAKEARVSLWLNPGTWVEDCDLCGGDHPEGPCQ